MTSIRCLQPGSVGEDQLTEGCIKGVAICTAFEARWKTWEAARGVIAEAEREGAAADQLRAGVLVLAELSLEKLQQRNPWYQRIASGLRNLGEEAKRLRHEKSSLSQFQEMALLHADPGWRPPRQRRGRPEYGTMLEVLDQMVSALKLRRSKKRPTYKLIGELMGCVFPPVPIARGREQLRRAINMHLASSKRGRLKTKKLKIDLSALASRLARR